VRYMGRNGNRHASVVIHPRDVPDPWRSSRDSSREDDDQNAILSQFYLFVPVAVETIGAINEAGMNFLGDLGRRIVKHADDHRESAFLFQRISTLIHRFNAVAVLGTFATQPPEEDVQPFQHF